MTRLVDDVLQNLRELVLRFEEHSAENVRRADLKNIQVAIRSLPNKRNVSVPVPSYRDLKSRGLSAAFDCSREHALLGWQPERDRARFLANAFEGFEQRPRHAG